MLAVVLPYHYLNATYDSEISKTYPGPSRGIPTAVYGAFHHCVPQNALFKKGRLNSRALTGMYGLFHRQNSLLEEIAKKKGVKNLPEEIDWEEKIVYGDDAETRKNFGTCIRGLDRNDSVERTIIGYIFGKH